MRAYFKYFRFLFIAIIVVAAVLAGCLFMTKDKEHNDRNNDQCDTTQRVYDYANKLTDSEIKELEALIAKREKQVECDIVLVTIDWSLEEYVAEYESQLGYIPLDQYVMVYADNFYDENAFGYNKPNGDGVIYVDNWYRESDGWCYSWFSTSGKAERQYSSSMINDLVEVATDEVNDDPFEAYKDYVNQVYYDMSDEIFKFQLSMPVVLVMAVICAVLFVVIHLSNNKGRKTTNASTYVNQGKPTINHMTDQLVNKVVTSRTIESSSSGGGGGSHRSAGGHSHGGGGGRH